LAIDSLPEAFRIVLIARAVEGLSVDETASLLGIKSETVKTRLHRARALLRSALKSSPGRSLTDTFPFGGERCARITANILQQLQLSENTVARNRPGAGVSSLRSLLIRFCY
jgi:RNA polymerase sigma-70 factor (ECF subfamily)